jgi:ADP-ribose pyrophosphatase YjhB (NUDIX family)
VTSNTKNKIVFSTNFFHIEELPAKSGVTCEPFYKYQACDGVVACVLDRNGDFLLVKQYRQSIDQYTTEFPAGGVDAGEEPMQAISREVSEELGVKADFLLLGTMRLMINRSGNSDFLFFGINPRPTKYTQSENYGERIRMPREQFLTIVRAGEFLQIAGLGVVQLASIMLNVDVLRDPIDEIYKRAEGKIKA